SSITGETSATLNVTETGTASYTVKVTDASTALNCEKQSDPVTVTIHPIPTASISGTLTACGSTELTAVTDAVSPSYVWYKDGSSITGETSATLNVTETAIYTVKVTDLSTAPFNCEKTSDAVTVTIYPLPITNLPVSATTGICPGVSADVLIELSEAGVEYQLRNSPGNVATGTPVTGNGGTIMLSTGALTETTTFSIVATNTATGCSVQLVETVTITVPLVVGGTITGTGNIVYGESTGALTLAGYTGSVVKWQKQEPSAVEWTDIANTSDVYEEIPSSAGTWSYRAVVAVGSCPETVSEVFTIIVAKAGQSVRFISFPDRLQIKDSFILVAESTTGLPVSFESLNTAVATLSGNQLTGISPGNVSIRAYSNGDSNYNQAEAVQSVEVYSAHKDILHLFTPNNDGINDYWEIQSLAEWGASNVRVFNRWGQLIFSEKNYSNRWDGTSRGNPLPEGAYYFIIDTENSGVVTGTVNIVR
ncbi:MAG: gliding motility-associated C-terminal domain-containing protein, partial [Bacteroidales bacterium]|nr:gliding motility-associated C-terminal domain-containing protein [Bacteroidales bacterium]